MGTFGLTLGVNWPAVLTGLMVVAFLFVCLVLILTVLIQRPQGGGLSGAFGSAAGSSQTAFGAKTGDVLTIFTIAVFVLFLASAVALNWRISPPPPALPTAVGLDDEQQPAEERSGEEGTAEEEQTGEPAIEPFQLPDETPPPAQQPPTGEAQPPAGEAKPPTGEAQQQGQQSQEEKPGGAQTEGEPPATEPEGQTPKPPAP